jgi:hypothetical protein
METLTRSKIQGSIEYVGVQTDAEIESTGSDGVVRLALQVAAAAYQLADGDDVGTELRFWTPPAVVKRVSELMASVIESGSGNTGAYQSHL